MARLFWLSDEAWARIEPHLPHGQPGKPRVDDRLDRRSVKQRFIGEHERRASNQSGLPGTCHA